MMAMIYNIVVLLWHFSVLVILWLFFLATKTRKH